MNFHKCLHSSIWHTHPRTTYMEGVQTAFLHTQNLKPKPIFTCCYIESTVNVCVCMYTVAHMHTVHTQSIMSTVVRNTSKIIKLTYWQPEVFSVSCHQAIHLFQFFKVIVVCVILGITLHVLLILNDFLCVFNLSFFSVNFILISSLLSIFLHVWLHAACIYLGVCFYLFCSVYIPRGISACVHEYLTFWCLNVWFYTQMNVWVCVCVCAVVWPQSVSQYRTPLSSLPSCSASSGSGRIV